MEVIKDEQAYNPPPAESIWIKFGEGTTTIRLLSHSLSFSNHYLKDQNKTYDCTGQIETCQWCQKGNKPRQRWAYLVILRDAKSPSIKVAEVGWSIFKTILELSKDKDYGDPRTYDLKINRTGTDLDTEYTVIPGKDIPFNDKEMALLMPGELLDPEKATDKLMTYYKKEEES